MITKNVTVYLGDGHPVRIPVSQYDTMWRFVFKVVYNDEEWTIPEGAEVVLNGRKQDGNVFAYHGTVSNNRITVDCHVQITPVPGEVFCELSIMSGTKTVGTANFIIDVEQAPKTNDDVISESALDAYGEILDEIATVTGHMVPAGGSSGQVLAKLSGDDYDTGWVTGGGGGISDVKVNGVSVVSGGVASIPTGGRADYGVVKVDNGLDAASINPVQNLVVTAALSAKYEKPAGGIPASDLASGVIPSVPSAYTSSPSALGTASAGTSTAWAKGDHVHPMPSASDVGAAPAITEVTNTSTGAVSLALDAGKIYHFTGSLTSLSLTLNTASGTIPQYHFDFVSGSTAPTLTVTGATMPDSFTVETGKTYEVDVLNGRAVVFGWTTSS